MRGRQWLEPWVKYEEVFLYYDQPVLFTVRNVVEDLLFLVVFADSSELFQIWLMAPVSEERMKQIKLGCVDLHDAFSNPEDGRVHVVIESMYWRYPARAISVKSELIPDKCLPDRGERLND
jgi:hypothetical protein